MGIPLTTTASRGSGAKPETPLETAATESNDLGGLITFFAAQTHEETPERELPAGHPERRTYGLFTYTLAGILQKYPTASYRQVGRQLLQRYAAISRAPTPLFAGTDLDATVFRDSGKPSLRQWRISRQRQRLTLSAGLLHGIAEGAIIAIVPTPTAGERAVLGYAEVRNPDPLEARLVPMDYNDKPAPTRLPRQSYGRLAAVAVDLQLTVARPPVEQSQAPRLARLLGEIEHERALDIRWVESDQGADLRLFIQDQRLWLLPPSGELLDNGPQSSLSIGLNQDDDRLKTALLKALRSIAKALNLMRLGSELPNIGAVDFLAINAAVERADSGAIVPLGDRIPELRDGDLITFKIANQGSKPADVTALYIDSAYGIEPWFPEPGQINRIESGGTLKLELEVAAFKESGELSTLGKEHLFILAIQAEPGTERADYTFLAQPGLSGSRSVPPSKDASELEQLLLQAGFARAATRGGVKPRPPALARARFHTLSWEVLPPSAP